MRGEVRHDVEFPPLTHELGKGHVELGRDESTELLAAPDLQPKRHGIGAHVEGAPVAAATLTPANLPPPGWRSAETHAVTSIRLGRPPPSTAYRRAANRPLRIAPDEVIGSAKTPEGRVVEVTAGRWSYIRKYVEMEGRMDLVTAGSGRLLSGLIPMRDAGANGSGSARHPRSRFDGSGWL